MTSESMKETAETLLRELPSVLGACVRADVYGHPREVHLLVRAGPNPRHLAYDIRDLLEERLGVPIDQRVISIAQLAPGREPGSLLGGAPDDAAPAAAAEVTARAATQPAGPADPRVVFTSVNMESIDNRVRIRVALDLDGTEHRGDAIGLDTAPARLRTCATAVLQAVDATCIGRARFEVEHVGLVRAFEREYVLLNALVSSPYLGRRPIPLVGAQPVEMDVETAVALAGLKAVNRTLSLVLRLGDEAPPHARHRQRRS